MIRRPPRSTLFPYTTLFRSHTSLAPLYAYAPIGERAFFEIPRNRGKNTTLLTSLHREGMGPSDRKSTRLNSSHANISYAVFCLKKKKNYMIFQHFSLSYFSI